MTTNFKSLQKYNVLNQSTIFKSIEENNLQDLLYILKTGTDLNKIKKDGISPLQYASKLGRVTAVELFLIYGANPNLKTINGETALILACYYNHSKVVKKLLEFGANPNLADNVLDTPLHAATSERIIKMLIKAGANPNLVNLIGIPAVEIDDMESL